jgi:hypothetical protein
MSAELNQLMLEHEEFLESALDDMEYGALLTDDQVACIRQACGKPKQRKNETLTNLFNDFGTIFRSAA